MANDKVGDMLKMGIIDPAKVTKTALTNAVSVAGTLLTTNCIVYKEQQEEKKTSTKKKLPLEVTDEAIEGISPKQKKINQTLDVAERLFKTFDGKINLTTENSGAREAVAKYDPNTNTVILNLDNPDLDIDAPFHVLVFQ